MATDVGLATSPTILNDSIKLAGSLPWRLSLLQMQKHDAPMQSAPMLPQRYAINAPSVKQGLSSVQLALVAVAFAPPPTQRESCAEGQHTDASKHRSAWGEGRGMRRGCRRGCERGCERGCAWHAGRRGRGWDGSGGGGIVPPCRRARGNSYRVRRRLRKERHWRNGRQWRRGQRRRLGWR